MNNSVKPGKKFLEIEAVETLTSQKGDVYTRVDFVTLRDPKSKAKRPFQNERFSVICMHKFDWGLEILDYLQYYTETEPLEELPGKRLRGEVTLKGDYVSLRKMKFWPTEEE